MTLRTLLTWQRAWLHFFATVYRRFSPWYNRTGWLGVKHKVACLPTVDLYPVNMPDPVRIDSATLARSGPYDSCTPACFRTGSVCWHSLPEPNGTQAGFAQYDPGRLWKNATESEIGKMIAGPFCVLPEPARWSLAYWLASEPEAFG